MDPRISFITLGVTDLPRAITFYEETLGLKRKPTPEGVAFFPMGSMILALWPRDELARDAGVAEAGSGFRGFALAHNVRSEAEVEALLAAAAAGGGAMVKPGHKTFWGGYAGYFADPEGVLWEVAHNPGMPELTEIS